MENQPPKRRGRRRHPVRWALLVLLLALAVEFYASNNLLSLERIELFSERLPPAFDGYGVVLLSDLHARSFGEDNRALLEMVRREEPDAIAITGDIAERLSELPDLGAFLTKLCALAPVYYVTGNHEWGADWTAVRKGEQRFTPALFSLMDQAGVVRLDGRAEALRRGDEEIWLAGLCDPNGPKDSRNLREVLSGPRAGGADPFVILLSHRHELFDAYVQAEADVTLTGHAHGGVVRLPFTDGLIGPGRKWFPRYTSGLYRQGRSAVVVSRGLGPTDMPRLFNRPHVVALTLRAG